jgi:hypothetical protein
MDLQSGKFIVTRSNGADPMTLSKDGLVMGRLPSCEIVLNHATISRVHAGINRIGGQYFLINLSVSNTLTLNGRLLQTEQVDTLADGDVIQLGPFVIIVGRQEDSLTLFVKQQFTGDVTSTSRKLPGLGDVIPQPATAEVSDVLKVFWEKRTREKEDWGTMLRPVGKALPGKARINWRPTGDLTPSWRGGLFTWSLLIITLMSLLAIYIYPQFFSHGELSNPHTRVTLTGTEAGFIANRPNGNACSTCHTLKGTIDNACVTCHKADAFHASNTQAHESAGINCTTCHAEHKGENHSLRTAALNSCASCHNDSNKSLYNGKGVGTPHKNTHGYPTDGAQWKWGGLKPERAALSPDVVQFKGAGDNEQVQQVKEFHAVHLYRLTPAPGMRTDSSGQMSCSSCHKSFDPIDRETPRQTCARCHNGYTDQRTSQVLISSDRPNCVSCHVQHYYDKNRWREFLTSSTEARRAAEIDAQIKNQGGGNTSQP